MSEMRTRIMRDASYLLPPPGGEVVRDLLDSYDALLARHNALETERHSLAQEIMRQVNKNEELHARHNALRDAVAKERKLDALCESEFEDEAEWKTAYLLYEAARAEVDRLLENES